MSKKYVYLFTEGNAGMRELLGGKGANLAEMTNIFKTEFPDRNPVPQGFTISTEACTQYYEDNREINPDIQQQINEYIVKLEEITGKKFGDKDNPLLVSVRSGARASMPGMMDTILNLGLNEEVVDAISEKSGNPRGHGIDTEDLSRCIPNVDMEVGKKYFEQLIDEMKRQRASLRTWSSAMTISRNWHISSKNELNKEKIGAGPSGRSQGTAHGRYQGVFRSWGQSPRKRISPQTMTSPIPGAPLSTYRAWLRQTWAMTAGTGVAFYP
jgi:pyruvate,orthophosphate dikinase